MNHNKVYFASAVVLIFSLGAFSADTVLAQNAGSKIPPAQLLLSRAIQAAQMENKNILLHFGASW